MRTLPNFLIVGAQKAGTSSVYQYTREHPDVYMSEVKEPEFFALEGREVNHRGPDGCTPNENDRQYTDLETYQRLFDNVDGETAVGEASTLYLYSPRAPERIHHYVPDAKLIAILRNPVERAYSAFLMAKRSGNEPLSFAEALAAEEERTENGFGYLWRYKDFGRYHEQLRRYLEHFSRGQLRVFLLEDLKNDPEGLTAEIYRFIGVDDTYSPDVSLTHNKGGVPRSDLIEEILSTDSIVKDALKGVIPETVREHIRHFIRDANYSKPTLDRSVRRALTGSFEQEILRLQDLIDRDLSHWLNPESEWQGPVNSASQQ